MSSIAAPQAAAQTGPGATGRVLCAADPERMFPLDEDDAHRPDQEPTVGERRALAVCRRCEVLESCREAVLELPIAYGVAGGLTAGQRREVRSRRAGRADGQRPGRVAAGAVA